MIQFDMTETPYMTRRYPVVARNGMVCTGSSAAANAGLRILQAGGNAVDAAIATAAALTVVEPSANGIGSDMFALVWMKDELYGLNSSGKSPSLLSIDNVKNKHGDILKMPTFGWTPVTVPGAPKGWIELSKKFGKLPFKKLLEPAIDYAMNGFALSGSLAHAWNSAYKRYLMEENQSELEGWYHTFLVNGEVPKEGDIITLKDHGKTLQLIADSDADEFYMGSLARIMEEESIKANGFLRRADLEAHEALWVEPISVNYRGYDIWEIPPNGQGIVALMGLNILKEFSFLKRDTLSYHRQFEAMKMAFADGQHYVSDVDHMQIDYRNLLLPEYGKKRSVEISETAKEYLPDTPPKSGTVYLCTADAEGNMVSLIQSNYFGFGSGIVVKGTGISLQNRGHDFSLDEKNVNVLKPNKRSYHTIIPGFITKNNQAVGPFGVMGGYMQPQGHIQVVMNLIDYRLNPQAALDAPRWQWMKGKEFIVEKDFDNAIAKKLKDMGHRINFDIDTALFGRGQIIIRKENGALIGGTESRTDGCIASW